MNELEKEFVPYEFAVKLKDLGFDAKCLAFYTSNKMLHIEYTKLISGWQNSDLHNAVIAPTFSQAFRWFREKQRIASEITCINSTRMDHFKYNIHANNDDIKQKNGFDSYEEAELACLEKLIEIVEDNNQQEELRNPSLGKSLKENNKL